MIMTIATVHRNSGVWNEDHSVRQQLDDSACGYHFWPHWKAVA